MSGSPRGRTARSQATKPTTFEGNPVGERHDRALDPVVHERREIPLGSSENDFRLIVENLNDVVYAADQAGVFTYMSPAVARLSHYTAEEMLGKPFATFVHPDDIEELEQSFQRLLAGVYEPSEFRIIDKNGAAVWLRSSSRLICENGQVTGVTGVFADITARKLAEAALKESAEHYRSLFENAHELIYFHDMAGNFTAFNRAAQRITGYSAEEATSGLDLARLVAPEDFPFVERLLKQLAGGAAVPPSALELDIITKDGRRVSLEVSTQPLRQAGRLIGVQGIARDVTDSKRAHAEIRRLNEELEQRVRDRTAQFENATKEMEAFSYSVSHDLRAPLRVIEGFSHVFLEEYGAALDAEARHYVERIHATSLRMGELISDLLALSRVTRTAMYRSRVDLSAMARSIAAELHRGAPDRDVRFEIRSGVVGDGDRSLLRIVMQNLLDNAWKYTSKKPRARIEFGAVDGDDGPVYFVRDDGAGFDMHYVAKLFGAFQRLHSAAEFDGTGIGLATVHRIVQRHGGRVWAEGEENEGATFYFTLPPLRWKV